MEKYQQSPKDELPAVLVGGALPFGYESTGVETRFTSGLDPEPPSRPVFSFHRPTPALMPGQSADGGVHRPHQDLGGFCGGDPLAAGGSEANCVSLAQRA